MTRETEAVITGLQEPPSRILVLGGDATGARLAEKLADSGLSVVLLGSNSNSSMETIPDGLLTDVTGFVHDYTAEIATANGLVTEHFTHIVCAQPARVEARFKAYGLEPSSQVVSLSEFLKRDGLNDALQSKDRFHVAFLCGLRGSSRPAAFDGILRGIERLQQSDRPVIFVFSRDLHVAGANLESRYRGARERGAVFFKFSDDLPTFESSAGVVKIHFNDAVLGSPMELTPDLLVVDEEYSPPDLAAVARLIPSSHRFQPFIQPYSPRFAGMLTPKAGIYAIGPARGVYENDLIASDIEAAPTFLRSRVDIPGYPGPAVIDPVKCAACLTCMRTCPHGAIGLGSPPEVHAGSCFRCGVCLTVCPQNAISFRQIPDEYDIGEQIRSTLTRTESASKIVVFLCSRSAAQAYVSALSQLPETVGPVVVPCAGAVDERHILDAFMAGALGVLVAGCFDGNCASIYGTTFAGNKAAATMESLKDIGMDARLVRMVRLSSNNAEPLIEAVQELTRHIGENAHGSD